MCNQLRKLDGKCIVWLSYFDLAKTRSQGRKISKRLAFNSPHLDEIVKAAEILNLNPQLTEARYSKFWWQKSGYVTLDKIGSKTRTLIELAKKMNEIRKRVEIPRKV